MVPFMSEDSQSHIQSGVVKPHSDDFKDILDILSKEIDRGMVLTGCSYFEDRLARLISAYLCDTNQTKDVTKEPGPFGTFSLRITGCYCLGLITKHEHDQLNILRKVRNQFAHDFRMTMGDGSVGDRLRSTEAVSIFARAASDGKIDPGTFVIRKPKDAREIFLFAVFRFAQELESRIHAIEEEGMRLEPVEWRRLYA